MRGRSEEAVSAKPGMLVVVTAHNVESYLPKLVGSLSNQTEHDWRGVFVDDASTDDTFSSLSQLLKQHQIWDRFMLIRNDSRKHKAHNVYTVLRRYGAATDIVVIHDGDDWLCHEGALSRLRQEHEQG